MKMNGEKTKQKKQYTYTHTTTHRKNSNKQNKIKHTIKKQKLTKNKKARDLQGCFEPPTLRFASTQFTTQSLRELEERLLLFRVVGIVSLHSNGSRLDGLFLVIGRRGSVFPASSSAFLLLPPSPSSYLNFNFECCCVYVCVLLCVCMLVFSIYTMSTKQHANMRVSNTNENEW